MINLDKKVYDHLGNFVNAKDADLNKGFKEHCPFKNDPCNYNGHGWYDRCACCKDNNNFIKITKECEVEWVDDVFPDYTCGG